MKTVKMGWIASLLLVYGCFWIWYGGNGDPLGQSDGEAMFAEMEEIYGINREDAP